MPRRDFTQVAFDVVQIATGAKKPVEDTRTPYQKAQAEFGKTGGLKGGVARKKALTSKRRTQIAKKAAATRWSKKV